eukprot:COSAG06_NODE_8250_length_2223_cov_5.708098_1_plen_700_part_10
MKVGALARRAALAGVDDSLLDEAETTTDPKAAILQLILQSMRTVEDAPAAELRRELVQLKIGALSRRALAEGVESDALDVAEDSADPKAAIIELLVAQHNQTSSLTPLTDGEAGVLDHLRNGDADQRGQAYTELEAAVARRDTALLASSVPAVFEVMCFDADTVDTCEYQRVGILLSSMVCVDPVLVGSESFKEDRYLSLWSAQDSALATVVAKPLGELTREDAITCSCQFAYFSPILSNCAAVWAAASLEDMAFFAGWGSSPYAQASAEGLKLRLSVLLEEILREPDQELSEHVYAGVALLLGWITIGVPEISKRLVDAGILDFVAAELRKSGSAMDWTSAPRNPTGYFGQLFSLVQTVCLPSLLQSTVDITPKLITSGCMDACLSTLKAIEVLGGANGDVSAMSMFGALFGLLNLDSTNVQAQRAVREAASCLRYLLIHEPIHLMKDIGCNSPTGATMVAALFFGRDESGGSFSFSQNDVDELLKLSCEDLRPTSWGNFHPLLPNWTSEPNRNIAISDTNKSLLLKNAAWIPHLLDGLLLDESHPRNVDPRTDEATKGKVQCDYAEAISNVALYAPGRAALLQEPSVVRVLEELAKRAVTEEARLYGQATLLALGVTKPDRPPLPSLEGGGGDASKLPPPHVMASYNWDHQDVILRVVASLQGRGYLVWVDTEQMKGATVDTMALAVEGAAVVLVGVS